MKMILNLILLPVMQPTMFRKDQGTLGTGTLMCIQDRLILSLIVHYFRHPLFSIDPKAEE